MYAPYIVKKNPDVFVVQLGGGISSNVALAAGAKSLTVAESNPALLKALTGATPIAGLTGNPLKDGKVRIVPYDGRLYLGGVRDRYDIVDLSLTDSTGLSHAGGFAIVEKYNYTVETLQDYMRALKPDGVLAITLWNKEDLPKSVPKLFATVVSAARGLDGDAAREQALHLPHLSLDRHGPLQEERLHAVRDRGPQGMGGGYVVGAAARPRGRGCPLRR